MWAVGRGPRRLKWNLPEYVRLKSLEWRRLYSETDQHYEWFKCESEDNYQSKFKSFFEHCNGGVTYFIVHQYKNASSILTNFTTNLLGLHILMKAKMCTWHLKCKKWTDFRRGWKNTSELLWYLSNYAAWSIMELLGTHYVCTIVGPCLFVMCDVFVISK